MDDSLPRVLFLCTGNSCRSQMAEGWLRHLAGARFQSFSAGTRPQGLNRGAVASMERVGIDISSQQSKDIVDFVADPPDLIVTVCESAAKDCPQFDGPTHVAHWPFPDPAHARGSEESVSQEFDAVREAIRARIEDWITGGAVIG